MVNTQWFKEKLLKIFVIILGIMFINHSFIFIFHTQKHMQLNVCELRKIEIKPSIKRKIVFACSFEVVDVSVGMHILLRGRRSEMLKIACRTPRMTPSVDPRWVSLLQP